MMTMCALVLYAIIDYLTVLFHHMRMLFAQVLVNKCTFYVAPLLVYMYIYAIYYCYLCYLVSSFSPSVPIQL